MKKFIFCAVILTVCFVSCSQDELFKENNEAFPVEISDFDEIYRIDSDANQLRPFGKALYEL